MAIASIIIPAHNESQLIDECLISLGVRSDWEIIVVANGCDDDTAVLAAAHQGVRVIELDQSSKIAALNAGDAAATASLRVYLDADIQLDGNALAMIVAALRNGAPAAAPRPIVDTTSASVLVRLYFAIWGRLGYATVSSLGAGVYGLSESGRGRFDSFPQVIADDGFVYSLFKPSERVNPDGASFTIRAPRSLKALVKRRRRIAAGNRQLLALGFGPAEVPGPGWRTVLLRSPHLLPAAVVYLAVNFVGERAGSHMLYSGEILWGRDDTSRQHALLQERKARK